ncbi:MAG: GNAT family N-acetyltransferase [Deltaproteobacteria bacterium]|nr:GNAT family N-acetyltransferase [Deltaproteobacteria bacterium]
MTEAKRQASARILAGTLTLLAREEEGLPSPFALWNSPLTPGFIKEAALKVASGLAGAVWADDSYPARGLLLRQEQALETLILGQKSVRLAGPWLMDPEPADRQRRTAHLARKAADQEQGPVFMAIKTVHDPAIIRGFAEAGFQVAEISTQLAGTLNGDIIPEFPFVRHPGLFLKTPEPEEGEKWLRALGELFYDGHYLHGPYLPPDFSCKLWQAVTKNQLYQGQPVLFLWEESGQRPVALAMAAVSGREARLSVLHVTEDRRGQGLGKLLLLELVRVLIKRQVTSLACETASYNLPALALYQAMGFRIMTPLITFHFRKP